MNIRTTDEFDDLEVWWTAGARGVITGNPHTHPGRFDVRWDGDDRSHPASLSDLAQVSRGAELWLAGFLAGQSPDAHEVVDPAEDFLSDAERAEWLGVCGEFQQTGAMPQIWRDRRAHFEADRPDD